MARLVEVTNPSAVFTVALAIFQIATVVVGQQHLSSIGERLRILGDGLARLDAHFKHEKLATIQAAYEQLLLIAQPAMQGDWDSDFLVQLSSIERDLNEAGQFAQNAVRAELVALEHAQLRRFSNARKAASPLENHVAEIDYLLQLWGRSLDARIVALQVLAHCPELSSERFLALERMLRTGVENYAAAAKEAYSVGFLAVGRVETVVPFVKRRVQEKAVSALRSIRTVRDLAAELVAEHRRQLDTAATVYEASRGRIMLYAKRAADGTIQLLVPEALSA